MPRTKASLDLTGKVFGSWTVLYRSSRSGYRHVKWMCRCICGTEREVFAHSLTEGTSQRCLQCKYADKRLICKNGHNVSVWGQATSGNCKGCLRNSHLKRTYGITLDEFIQLYEYQKGQCCICHKDFVSYIPGEGNRIEVDHDHKIDDKRKSIRGLLCGGRFAGCNRKLGKIDNTDWLLTASNYVVNPPAQKILQGEG